MVGSRQAGFTIIEITLFMGITGLLFIIAILGTGNAIRTVRFTDSGRSLEAYVQKQYDDILNGLNDRSSQVSCNSGTVDTTTAQNVGTSNCVVMGRLLQFASDGSTITTYKVIGTEPPGVNYSQSDDQLIISFNPQVVTTTGVTTYDVPWGAPFTGFKRLNTNTATNGLLLVRSPSSTRIISYTFKIAGATPTASEVTTAVNDVNSRGQTTNFCIKNSDHLGSPAKLVVTGGSGQTAASINFNATDATDCNGL
jgi:type II secretory pathway pseudopilin PulG